VDQIEERRQTAVREKRPWKTTNRLDSSDSNGGNPGKKGKAEQKKNTKMGAAASEMASEVASNMGAAFSSTCGTPQYHELQIDAADEVKMSIPEAASAVFCHLNLPDPIPSEDFVIQVKLLSGCVHFHAFA
jgi:hypothetical protein